MSADESTKPERPKAGLAHAPESEEHRARARRRLLKLAMFVPPTLLTLSSLSGFLYGMRPKPPSSPSVVPGVVPKWF